LFQVLFVSGLAQLSVYFFSCVSSSFFTWNRKPETWNKGNL